MRLKAYLSSDDRSYSEFAAAIRVDASRISRAAAGLIMPSPKVLEAIKAETGGAVTANDFHDHVIEVLNHR